MSQPESPPKANENPVRSRLVAAVLKLARSDWVALLDLSPWLILAIGLAASLAAYHHFAGQFRYEAQLRFERQTREIHRAIASRLTSYTDLLWGMRGLYEGSPQVSRRQFHDYVQTLQLDKRYPAVTSINYAEQVVSSDRAAFEKRVTVEAGFSGPRPFRIIGPPDRAESQVLIRLEPFMAQVHGVDLTGARSQSWNELKASGGFLSSGEIVPRQPGLPLAIRLPVYRPGASLDEASRRIEAFQGSLGMGFSLLSLICEVVPPDTLSIIRVRISNLGRSSQQAAAGERKPSLLLDSARDIPDGASFREALPANRLLARTSLDFGGALLGLEFSGSVDVFPSAHSRNFPVIVLMAGMAVSMLLALVVAAMLRGKGRLQAAVARHSVQLQEANRALERQIDERNRLERDVMQLLVDERRRFGQELHDNLGQQLVAAGFQVEALRGELAARSHASSAQAEGIGEHLASIAGQARMLAHALNPVSENTGGLPSALERLVQECNRERGRHCRFDWRGEVVTVEPWLAHNFFLLAQHALTGAVARGASAIGIELTDTGAELELKVSDDGRPLEHSGDSRAADIALRFIRFRCAVLGLALETGRDAEGRIVVGFRTVRDDELPQGGA